MRRLGIVVPCRGPAGLIFLMSFVASLTAKHSQPLLGDTQPCATVGFAQRVLSHALSFTDVMFVFFLKAHMSESIQSRT